LSEVAFDAGFADQAHFSRLFKATFGLTPARYRALILDRAAKYSGLSWADCPGRDVAPAPAVRIRDDPPVPSGTLTGERGICCGRTSSPPIPQGHL
jgi:hypothetical protein